jgi:hypothetical protein
MSRWTHPVCYDCYDAMYPRRHPVRVNPRQLETCCRCGEPTRAGIYVRADPDSMEHCAHD